MSSSTQSAKGALRGRADQLIDALSAAIPSAAPHLVKARPVLIKVADGIEVAIPIAMTLFQRGIELRDQLSPHRLDLLLPSLIGLMMCFFGGSYMTLIAAVEAYRMVGWESSYRCVMMLVEDLKKLNQANDKDDADDKDGDGVADVKQISKQELVTRKTLLFLKTIDPKRLSDAIAGLNAGFLAVVATLKLQFAKAITLGNAIGEMLERPAMTYALPTVERVLPADLKRWAAPAISYTCRTIAISVAWTIQRIISAFHSALRGGLMCSRNILEYLSEMKIYHINHEETMIDEFVGYALAILGLWFQLGLGFQVPFPFNVILLPATIAEWVLMHIVSK